MSKLNNYIESHDLKSGLFGKKPTGIDLYENGILLKYKTEEKEYLFSEIPAIKASNYFEPNPPSYYVDIFDTGGNKIAALSFPYVQRENVTNLLIAHKEAIKGADFSDKFAETKYIINDDLTWENGKLYYKWKKGIAEYSPDQIESFVCKNGLYFFALKDSKDTIVVSPMNAPNCLLSIDICYKIASI